MKAFLFDLNGTMIDDMQFHIKAWHSLLNNELGGKLSVEEVKEQMYGKNAELLVRVFGKDKFSKEEMDFWSVEKEKRYQTEFKPLLSLIAGLPKFLEDANRAGIPMAIGSAAITFNIDFVLDNLNIRHYFKAIVSADNVAISKPDPETYLMCAALLGVDPKDCIVFEDAPKGVEAADNAGMDAVVLTTMHEEHEFGSYGNVIKVVKDYTEIQVDQLNS
ncbi:MAG: HAD family phosphatase [Gemmatimonadaceae bacterium]|nr:HAD family phosphatase [Chitinophagaceae bacterium]